MNRNFICNGPGIAFDRVASCSYGNDFARNVIIVGVGNRKNSSLVLCDGLTADINDSIGTAESRQKNSIDFTRGNTKLLLKLYYNGDKNYLYINRTETCKLKAYYNSLL